jgi:hypothetical protein
MGNKDRARRNRQSGRRVRKTFNSDFWLRVAAACVDIKECDVLRGCNMIHPQRVQLTILKFSNMPAHKIQVTQNHRNYLQFLLT